MKKLLCLLLAVVLCLGILAGCGGGEEYDLASAKTLLNETYKGMFANASNDYDLPGKVVVGDISYVVTWATDSDSVTIKKSTKEGYYTVDVPESNATEAAYKLIATITAPDGEFVTLELDRTLPVYDNTETVDPSALKADTAYKLYLEQKSLNQTLYALATTQKNENKFINTTLDPTEAADFYVEIVDGGYKFYTTVDNVKTYIYAKTETKDDGKVSKYVGFSTTEATVWAYNPVGVFETTIDGGKYGIGTYGSYQTISISDGSYFTADTIGNTQYVVKVMLKTVAEEQDPSAEVTIPTLENAVEPTAGNKYNLAMAHGGKENATYYVTGAMNGYYAQCSTTVADAANFYVEAVSGGFNVYGIIAGEKLYVNFVQSGSYVNIKFEATAATVFTYDATLKTMKATVGTSDYILGLDASKTFETVGPVVATNLNFYAQFVVSTNADQTAPDPGEGGDPTPDPTPSGNVVDLTVDSLGLPSQSYTSSTATVNGVAFEFIQLGNYGNGIQMRDKADEEGKTSFLWNTAAFGTGIVKIELTYAASKDVQYGNADAVIFTFGNEMGAATYTTKLSTTAGVKTYTITPDVATYTFFKLEHDLGYTFYWDSIKIYYSGENAGGTTPTPDPTPDPEITTSTIAAVIAGADGEYQVAGTVIAVNARSFLVKDNTGIMLVYVGSAPGVAAGDVVTVKGTSSIYGAAKQLGSATVTKTGTTTVDHGTVTELTATQIDAYATAATVTPIYVKVTATLSKSGNYYNLAFAGATITGSIPYPANGTELDALADKEVEITGYVVYVSGSSSKYLNILAMNVVEVNAGGTTPTPDPDPDPTPTTKPAPEAGIYTLAVNENGTVKYLDGGNTDKNFRWTFGDAAKATFELVVVDGGYNLKLTTNATGVTKYLNIVIVDDTYVNLLAEDTAVSVWKWNAEQGYLYVTVEGKGDYTVMQTSGDYGYYANVEAKVVTTTGNIFFLTATTAHTHSYSEATCAVPATCACGKTDGETLPHNYVNGVCGCGALDPNHAVSGQTYTASKTIDQLKSENPTWTTSGNNATKLSSIKLDDNVTVSINGGQNSGKVYDDGIRIYATDSPAGTLTISVPTGYQLVSVKVTAVTGTYAFLYVDGAETDICNTTVAVSGTSVVLNSVKNGDNGKQVRIAAIEVVYQAVN